MSFSDVPGCISAGDSFEEAAANAGEALLGHLEVMRADGDPILQPRSFEELRRDREFMDDAAAPSPDNALRLFIEFARHSGVSEGDIVDIVAEVQRAS